MAVRYQYDKMDRLTEESYDGEAVGYIYDLCGNRMEKVDKNGKEVYTYNVKNQLASRKSEKAEIRYRYDQQGNVLEATGTERGIYYSYNAFNQQIKVHKSDGSSLESQYDAEYLRAGTVENGKVSSFQYYNGELLAELDQEQEVSSRYVLGYGVAAGWKQRNEDYHFYHLDEQNSTAHITGAGGGIENRYQYDAFGTIRDRQEQITNRNLYTGQQYDHIMEQYYLRARYYNPVIGRFVQEDTYRNDAETFVRYFEPNEAADVLEAMRNQQSKDPVEVLRPKVDKFGTVHRSAKWISEKGYEKDPNKLGKDRKYTLIMETEMGTKEWLQSHSTKDSKEVRNKNKVIIKDQEMGSYGVGIELLDEYNSKVVSATLIDENGKQIETCKKA